MNAPIKLAFDIQGMTCDSCARHVEKALSRVPGVQAANVPGWDSQHAIVEAGDDVDTAQLEKAVAEAGYQARLRKRQAPAEHPVNSANAGADFDLMVVGGGSAGFAAAIKGHELSFKVGLVNRGTLGGTCVNIGCVPSKALIRAMESYHQAASTRFKGIQTMAGQVNWPQVIAHKDELVAELRQSKYVDVLEAYPDITLLEGHASLSRDHRLLVEDKHYHYRKLILATGASPWSPLIPGLAETPYLTSTTALSLRELPHSLIVLGANAVGLELAQVYARAGVAVTIVEVLPCIVPFEDEDISAALKAELESEGLRIVVNFKTTRVDFHEGRFTLSGEDGMTLSAEQLLVATGRRANTAGIGLEEAGIDLGERGEILVNETLQTSLPDVYAAGDVTGRDMFVYVAAYAGQLAVENALTESGRVYDAAYIPRVTFTDPQIASAGLTESQAREQGYEIKTSLLPMKHVPRALAARDTRGVVKLVVDAANDQILGAHILAPEAGEMIQTAVLAMRFGIRIQQLRETMFPYLTNAEALKLAVLAFEKDVSQLSCCAG
ncbi:MAG: mercury(II) reductase [Anaerolineales bacterium]|nr:mercury(II) reductase [Anaerolineales bacterium]